MKQFLFPTLDDLREEFVLMQAWKKTSTYLRQHSWYADTLEIDYQSLRVPDFLREIQERLKTPEAWVASLLDFVPAPKSQSWQLVNEKWKPREPIIKKIRPLAHLDLQDQVVATAILMCLADRVEQALGNPLESIDSFDQRRKVLAYGHRLFCDTSHASLQHRWGSSKLYRLYFNDYETFLRRPELVSEKLAATAGNREIAIVQSDLSKFYDRVRPALLHEKVRALLKDAETQFFALFQRVFNWRWKDEERARRYAELHGIEGFETIALPQGLVASGFFANIVLQDFDVELRGHLGRPIDSAGLYILKDVCYYVDDLRLVLLVNHGASEIDIESTSQSWLQEILNRHASGLVIEPSKTKATVRNRQKRFLVRQSKTATRIQQDLSGVFDMLHGSELIGAIEGFFHTQKRFSSDAAQSSKSRVGLLTGMSDMRDDTAARFAAGRFRRTFRSLRPLLLSGPTSSEQLGEEDESDASPLTLVLSREQLDERGELFSMMLIDEWVSNPGNVRLLRIALDLYPDDRFLDRVLQLLKSGWSGETGVRGPEREVKQYCLAEIFRAGATETGIVSDDDCLPSDIDITRYHKRLADEGVEILAAYLTASKTVKLFPWFLIQQVALYLIVWNRIPEPFTERLSRRGRGLSRHQRLISFLRGTLHSSLQEQAVYLILSYSSFELTEEVDAILRQGVSSKLIRCIAEISPAMAKHAWSLIRGAATDEQAETARALGLEPISAEERTSLADVVLRRQNPFWQEENILGLAEELLRIPASSWPAVTTPWQISCNVSEGNNSMFGELVNNTVKLRDSGFKGLGYFSVPGWCESADDRQRFQLGMILRFALRGSVDLYGANITPNKCGRPRYRQPLSHWERQRYSTFQGRTAFGPPWIPISSWTEDFLFDLLRWPGSGLSTVPKPLADWIVLLSDRLASLRKARGSATSLPFLEQRAPWPACEPKSWTRPLRVGIVQSITPDSIDYEAHLRDPELIADPVFRTRQRRHLSALLEGVVQMLLIRETHRTLPRADGRVIDLLVFPELSIHPQDIQSLIIPFVRRYKCMVLFGQVFHRAGPSPESPLINSCMWAIPEWRVASGFQVRFVEQGKGHLTSNELRFTPQPTPFRPAQWIVEYQWSSERAFRPLRLSASVCYDATDLALASDLKSRNDLYLVCALNQDVGTFDRMSEGLHYHMYQGVIVINNGQFGGSSFFMPFGESFHRQVFHLHGQPQATIAFAEVSPQKLVNRPNSAVGEAPMGGWKTQPANWP